MSRAAHGDRIACLTGIAPWKRGRIAAMLAPGRRLAYRADAAVAVETAARHGGALACWATRVPPDLPELALSRAVPLWLIEDGFVRSAGLGAALVQPCSIVVDRLRPHYDPGGASDLENLLAKIDLDQRRRQRAADLIQRLVSADITKYNLAGERVALPEGRPVVLVVGQVDSDASLQFGGYGLTSRDLLERAKRERGDAFIVYRPHPDVTAGLRDGHVDGLADLVAAHAPITQLIEAADEVHVLTSLAGFEALLRGRRVVVHGGPFYAGWGLTDDRQQIARRTRRLSREELVYGALIAYPLYANPKSGKRCEIEELIDELVRVTRPDKVGAIRRMVGKVALGLEKFRSGGRV